MKLFFILMLTLFVSDLCGQNARFDSLKNLMATAKNDSERIKSLDRLSFEYLWSLPDSSLIYIEQEILLARQMKSDILLARAYEAQAWYYLITGDYIRTLYANQEALKLAEKSGNFIAVAAALDGLAGFYSEEGDYERAIYYCHMGKDLLDANWSPDFTKNGNKDAQHAYLTILNGLASNYTEFNQRLDSALIFANALNDAYTKVTGKMWAANAYILGNIHLKKKNYSEALNYYRIGVNLAKDIDNKKDLMDNYYGLANTLKMLGKTDSSIYYAKEVVHQSNYAQYQLAKANAVGLLAEQYAVKKNKHQQH